MRVLRLAYSRTPPRRRFSGIDARAVRHAGMVTRIGYLKGFGVFAAAPAQPADWQVDQGSLLALAASARGKPLGRLGRLAYFRGFGLSPTADVAASAVGSKVAAAGASAAATALGAGAAAGPIGLVAGAVIALALTLFQKQYFNVSDANAACATQEQVWQKYLSVQGHVAGRALGWNTMIVVWHGAVGAGLFPLNSQHLAFHEGTLNCAGTGAWSDSFLGETLQGVAAGCSANNCMPDALKKFNASAVPAGTPDAVYFVDSILLPMNAGASIPWITTAATNPVVHQLLYDLADAYLAEHDIASTPYVEYPAATATAATAAPAASATPTTASATSAPAQPAAAQMPAFPGFSSSLASNDSRLSEAWSESELSGAALWTPTGGGYFSTTYPAVTSKIQVGISGTSMLALRQDSDGGWAKYTGTFDPTGLNVSGSVTLYDSANPAGTTGAWSAQISAPETTAAAVASTGVTTPVASAPLATSMMSEGSTGAAPVNVTVTSSAPAAAAPAASTSSNTLLWVAIAGLGAVLLMGMMQHDKK